MFNIEKIIIYFVLVFLLTTLIYVFLDYKNKLYFPENKHQLKNNNFILRLSFFISLFLTFILIYIKEK